jgi:hypothetical protein
LQEEEGMLTAEDFGEDITMSDGEDFDEERKSVEI